MPITFNSLSPYIHCRFDPVKCSVCFRRDLSTLQGQTLIYIFSTKAALPYISTHYLQPCMQTGKMGQFSKNHSAGLLLGKAVSWLCVWPCQAPPVSLKITSLHGSTHVKQQTGYHLTANLPGDLEVGYKHASEVAVCCDRFTAKQLVAVDQHPLLYLISSFFCYNLRQI